MQSDLLPSGPPLHEEGPLVGAPAWPQGVPPTGSSGRPEKSPLEEGMGRTPLRRSLAEAFFLSLAKTLSMGSKLTQGSRSSLPISLIGKPDHNPLCIVLSSPEVTRTKQTQGP